MSDEKKTYETPKMEVEKMEPVHYAKSWNPGKGNDTTGSGNSDFGGNQGNGNKPHKK